MLSCMLVIFCVSPSFAQQNSNQSFSAEPDPFGLTPTSVIRNDTNVNYTTLEKFVSPVLDIPPTLIMSIASSDLRDQYLITLENLHQMILNAETYNNLTLGNKLQNLTMKLSQYISDFKGNMTKGN